MYDSPEQGPDMFEAGGVDSGSTASPSSDDDQQDDDQSACACQQGQKNCQIGLDKWSRIGCPPRHITNQMATRTDAMTLQGGAPDEAIAT